MGIEIAVFDEATGSEIARTILEPARLPETFAIDTTLTLGEDRWRVVAADPVIRGDIERAGRVRLTVSRLRTTNTADVGKLQYSMPTICDPLPLPDPHVSVADLRVFVIDEDLWRDVEWVAGRHAADVEANFAAIRTIRATASGPFPELRLRAEPATSLLGCGLTVPDVATALGSEGTQLDGVIIDTLGAGFIKDGFAFRLSDDAHVYGHCVDGEVSVLGLHRQGERASLPSGLAALARRMREADAALIAWPYAERIEGLDDLAAWYLSGRGCTKMPW